MTIRVTDLRSDAEIIALADGYYVKLVGDTMSGALTITPSGDTSLISNKNIILKSGQKLIFDGA